MSSLLASVTGRKIKVLVVDDSAIVRKLLSQTLSSERDIEVVGVAPDAFVARDKILKLEPDVLTLDIEMPRMDGLTFLKKLMQFHPLPVVVISSLAQSSSRAALEAMQYGAVEVLAKPGGPYSVGDLKNDLPHKIRAAARARLGVAPLPASAIPPPVIAAPPQRPIDLRPAAHSDSVVLIGASTGGTEAIREVLESFPEDAPPVLVVQHIPAVFSRAFADRLDNTCRLRVKEAESGDRLSRGLALVAPGNHHMQLKRDPSGYRVVLDDGPLVCYQRPSVDVLFRSASVMPANHFTAAILTGMGSDGAQGMLALKQAGAHTIAQNEATCVVFGMPREAIRLGASDEVVPLKRIAAAILNSSYAAPRTA
ncbi:MAG TPA: chemotaxis response regulator protein-glutamate methylesterase [Bryobacteraceae bacterium]|nr:chemotaxis response regulator protein-glutamate methylesterase [Bryobacteraceae bacterium]